MNAEWTIEVQKQPVDLYTGKEAPMPREKEMVDKHKADLHRMLYGYYEYEREQQAENRIQMHIDEQFVDGIQWRADDAETMAARGQPALVFDRLGTPIYWLLGNEKQNRKEFRVLPREENDNDRAHVKYQVMKYLDDVNHTQFHQSKAFEDQVIAGLGWTELGVDEGETNPDIFHRYQWWREMYGDSRDRSHDMSEARYVIRVKYIDLDMAINYFPEHKEMFLRCAESYNQLDTTQEWYLGEKLENSSAQVAGFGRSENYTSSGIYDGGRPDVVKFIEVRYRVPNKSRPGKSLIRYALMTVEAGGIVYDIENPYKHGQFGFVARYCYRRKDTNMPYGVVRKRRDAQEEYNKRRSKALHILNTRRIRMTEGAVEDIELLREEAARPDGILTYKKGHELAMDTEVDLAEAQLQLMSMSAQEIENGLGVTDENMGRQGNATSGKAIVSRQTQGVTVQATLMDNHRMASQIEGEITMMLIEQYWTEPEVKRVIGRDAKAEFVKINHSPETMLSETKADFILSPVDQTVSARMAMAETFLELAGRVAPTSPDESKALTAMALIMTDMPFAEQILAYMRETFNFPDPTHEKTDQERAAEQQAKQKAAALAERQEKLAMEALELANQKVSSEIGVLVEDRLKKMAEASDKKIEGYFSAIQAALQVVMNPSIAPVADSILKAPIEQPGIDAGVVPEEPVPVVAEQPMAPQNEVVGAQQPLDPENPETPGVGQNAGMQAPPAGEPEQPTIPME